MAARLSGDALATALGTLLGGTVRDLRRLSGGASRVTSAFDLTVSSGSSRPLILQMDRGDAGATQGGKVQMERALLEAAHRGGVPVPAVVAMGIGDDLGADWLVVERLEGETIPRKLLRDAGVGRAAAGPHHAVRRSAGRHPLHRPRRRSRGCHRATPWATRCPTSTCSGRCAPRSSSGRAGWSATARRPGPG